VVNDQHTERVGMYSDDEELCKTFVQMWAEAVIRQVKRVKELRVKAARDGRNYERMENWSPTSEDLAENFRAQWTEEQTLVWAAHQLERWAKRLAEERGQDPPEPDRVLANLRNALEHLDEAEFTNQRGHTPDDSGWVYSLTHSAVPGEKSWSLKALPSSRLSISTPEGVGPPAFGLIDVGELELHAEAYVRQIENEMMAEAESWWIDMNSGR
jgi:hypothetical protein